MRLQQSTEDELRGNVEKAIQQYKHARGLFTEYINDIPSWIPAPDGALRVRNAGLEQESALRELKTALQRLHNVVVFAQTPPR